MFRRKAEIRTRWNMSGRKREISKEEYVGEKTITCVLMDTIDGYNENLFRFIFTRNAWVRVVKLRLKSLKVSSSNNVFSCDFHAIISFFCVELSNTVLLLYIYKCMKSYIRQMSIVNEFSCKSNGLTRLKFGSNGQPTNIILTRRFR